MDEFIGFKPQDATLPGYIRFSVTKNAFGKISQNTNEAVDRLQRLSASKVLLIMAGKDAGIYEVYTNDGSYFCKITDDHTALLIMGVYPNSLRNQNNALKNGVCFRIRSGIIIQIKLTAPYEMYYDIVNGRKMRDNSYSEKNVRASLRVIREHIAMGEREKESKQAIASETYQPQRKLARLLQTATQYSELESALEERKAAVLGNVPYFSIKPIEFDRVDRVAYEFAVTGLDEQVFKEGVRVEVEDRNQEKQSAEIKKLVKRNDEPATAIHLLFNKHIDILEFNQTGWFSLSFSTVVKDVQLSATEAIRTGKARATYMDVVFGKNSSNGFASKNLTQVKQTLAKKKYPPNKSQVDAICAGINAKDVFLVMGPPGTGKTTVILEWVKYFVTQEHKRVLISSQNNKAVDNVLARIADEKDIDIIRVGSEAKLQSEVVPYMYENKITVLREEIATSTEKSGMVLTQLIRVWKAYCARLKMSSDLSARAEQARETLEQKVKQEFEPAYRALDEIYKKYNSVHQRRVEKASVIESLDGKISRPGKGAFKLFYRVAAWFYTFRIKSAVKKYDKLMSRECELAQDYNSKVGSYQQVHQSIRRIEFSRWETSQRESEIAIADLAQGKPAAQSDNIWNLFEQVQNNVIETPLQCQNMQDEIRKELQRAKALQDLIIGWKNEITSQQNYALDEIMLESVDLVGATCVGINTQKRFSKLEFDVTIIDEAGQIQVHNALVPLSVSNKLIMLGDHKQIPPSADQELMDMCEEVGVETELLEKSLFEKMYQTLPKANTIMLDTQYRMPAEIADTISDWFYGGKYYSPPFKKGLPSLMPNLFSRPYVIIDTSSAPTRYERKIEGGGANNPLEADIVTDIIRYLAADGTCDMKEVGVISAYKSQVKLIKNQIGRIVPKALANEMVATLDSYQGQERDIILYSFTKSSNKPANKSRIGFLNELRRLNVAMTRCKKMLVLIGDMRFLGGCEYCNQTEDGKPIYEKSEKEFSDFINKMVSDVKGGRGELISYQAFAQKMKGRGN